MNKPQSIIPTLAFVGKASLGIAVVSVICFIALLIVLGAERADSDYLTLIQSFTKSKQMLLALLVAAALVIITLCGLLTWFIGIYTTHRITGPLYRFSSNVDLELRHELPPRVTIRRKDDLQELARELEESFISVNNHYLHLGHTLHKIIEGLGDETVEQADLGQQIAGFLEEEAHARLK